MRRRRTGGEGRVPQRLSWRLAAALTAAKRAREREMAEVATVMARERAPASAGSADANEA